MLNKVWWAVVLCILLSLSASVYSFVLPQLVQQIQLNRELDEAKQERTRLQTEISQINADIESLTSGEGLRRAARCYAQFVEPGEEVYAVAGLSGCANVESK